jgi:hypothetical protein
MDAMQIAADPSTAVLRALRAASARLSDDGALAAAGDPGAALDVAGAALAVAGAAAVLKAGAANTQRLLDIFA